jgi:hypothetical protein
MKWYYWTIAATLMLIGILTVGGYTSYLHADKELKSLDGKYTLTVANGTGESTGSGIVVLHIKSSKSTVRLNRHPFWLWSYDLDCHVHMMRTQFWDHYYVTTLGGNINPEVKQRVFKITYCDSDGSMDLEFNANGTFDGVRMHSRLVPSSSGFAGDLISWSEDGGRKVVGIVRLVKE